MRFCYGKDESDWTIDLDLDPHRDGVTGCGGEWQNEQGNGRVNKYV